MTDFSSFCPLLTPWIATQRWFSGKGRHGQPTRIELLDPFPDTAACNTNAGDRLQIRPAIATISYLDGQTEYYHIPLAFTRQRPDQFIGFHDDSNSYVSDALTQPTLDAFVAGFTHPFTTDTWQIIHSTSAQTWVEPHPTCRLFPGQQSNSSVLVGSSAVVKIFRKLELGPNLDIEVSHALTGAGIDAIPTLFGRQQATIDTRNGSATVDLAMISELCNQATNGWDYMVDRLNRGVDSATDAAAIGRQLARVHHGLARCYGTSSGSGDEVADLMTARLVEAATQVEALAEWVTPVTRIFDSIRSTTIQVQRLHGDFHLGQTMKSSRGWMIIDFEGEPMKSMAERTRPDSVCRDLAGMIRSFHYAQVSATRGNPSSCDESAGPTHPAPTGPRPEHPCPASSSPADAFLAAYCAESGVTLAEVNRLLQAYLADKAIYEVCYEQRNRPDWIEIPLSAIHTLFKSDNV